MININQLQKHIGKIIVGKTGLEPAASWSQTRRSTN